MVMVLRFGPATAGLVIESYHTGVNRYFVAYPVALLIVLRRAPFNQNRKGARGAKVHLSLGRENFGGKVLC